MSRLEFVFDFISPEAFLAWTRLSEVERRCGVEARLTPVPLAAMDPPVAMSDAKASYLDEDRRRLAAYHGVELIDAPRCGEHALAAVAGASGAERRKVVDAVFSAVWKEGRDLSSPEALAACLSEVGIEATSGPVDAEAARARGVFALPTFFVDAEPFVGADRLHAIERALGGTPPEFFPQGEIVRPIEAWFDFSSPYAYLGVKEGLRRLGPDLALRPMLLGAVFKALGGPMVPLFEFSEQKRAYQGRDLDRQAAEAGVKFTFPTRFPMNTVKALRMVIASEVHRALVERIFEAYWAEDQDIDDPEVLKRLAVEVGLDGAALLERTQAQEVKQALFSATEEAVGLGVFGAPTFVVRSSNGHAERFWGRDRLAQAARTATADLAAQECVPCRGGVPPLDEGERARLLAQLGNGWEVVEGHHLRKEWTFPNFVSALGFVNRVGELAEEVGHHPNISFTWGWVQIEIFTHAIDGLADSDFVLAAKVDRIPADQPS